MIQYATLPASNLWSVAGSPQTLAPWLRAILGKDNPGFTAVTAVADAPVSGRVLALASGIGIAPLETPLTPEEVAAEMFHLSETGQARYGRPHDSGVVRGWEVRAAKLYGKPAAILFASWVHPRPEMDGAPRQEPPPQPGE